MRSLGRVVLATFLAGCPSTPAQKIQPNAPTVADAERSRGGAAPAIEACTTPARADLMVVDWTPEARGDLEVAMKEGVAVVAYDCKTVKLVPACSLAGTYGYIGTTRREKKIELSTSDEIAANLPVGGLSWLSDVGGKVGRESALLAQLVMVGKRSSAKKRADKAELDGGCEGATHYVRAATVGAFAVASGAKAELAAAATIFGKGAKGGSSSSTKVQAQDGDLDACATASPDGKAPPAQCGAIVRIELEPLGAAAGTPPELVVATCAPGFVLTDGACVRPGKPHQCAPTDAAACIAQCDAGHAGSCATAAALHRDGTGVAKDWAKAAELAQKACNGDALLGCRIAAESKLGGQGTKKDKPGAIALLDRACQGGDGMGCVELGVAKLADKKLAADAQYAFRRACYGGGEHEGCAWLGTLYADGKGGMTVNAKLAASFYDKGCKEGSYRACTGYADLLKSGKGVDKKDPARAKQLYEAACNAGHEAACKKK